MPKEADRAEKGLSNPVKENFPPIWEEDIKGTKNKRKRILYINYL